MSLNDVILSEVELVFVLKDVVLVVIYGLWVVNGVILIIIKKGKEGKFIFNYLGNVGFQFVIRVLELVIFWQYVEFYN